MPNLSEAAEPPRVACCEEAPPKKSGNRGLGKPRSSSPLSGVAPPKLSQRIHATGLRPTPPRFHRHRRVRRGWVSFRRPGVCFRAHWRCAKHSHRAVPGGPGRARSKHLQQEQADRQRIAAWSSPSRGVFPFILSEQSVRLAGHFRKPSQIVLRFLPTHIDHRPCVAPPPTVWEWRAASGCSRSASHSCVRSTRISRLRTVGHFTFVLEMLIFLSLARGRAHRKRAGRDNDHRGTAFSALGELVARL